MTILTVDDTPANIRLLTHHLEKQGYRVLTAEDGFEGFKAAIEFKPDLILLDIMMPGTDGYEVCELLKAEEATREIPVMFLTAKTDVEDKVRGFELGAVDYITKPFNLVEISARVQNQLEMKHCQQQNMRLKRMLYHLHPMLALRQTGEFLLKMSHDGEFKQKGVIEGWLSMAESFSEETEAINLKYWIDDVVEVMQTGVSGLIGFNVDIKESADRIEAMPGLLHIALLNVFVNSYEAMNSKGIVHISKETGPLPANCLKRTKAEKSDQFHKIVIKDKGIPDGRTSFNPENPFEITEPDFREFTLRLAAINQIFQTHGGAVEVVTQEKELLTCLYLPVV